MAFGQNFMTNLLTTANNWKFVNGALDSLHWIGQTRDQVTSLNLNKQIICQKEQHLSAYCSCRESHAVLQQAILKSIKPHTKVFYALVKK